MKSYMFMLQRRVIKYSLLLLRLAVMAYHSHPIISLLRFSNENGRVGSEQWGWAAGTGEVSKPHLTHSR